MLGPKDMKSLHWFPKSLIFAIALFSLAACQTTNKTAETVEQSTGAEQFEYIEDTSPLDEAAEAARRAEEERLQRELDEAKAAADQAKAEADRAKAEADAARAAADQAREEQALADEKAAQEAEARAKAEAETAAAEQARAAAEAAAEAAAAEAAANSSGSQGVVNEVVPLGMPTDSVYFDFDKSMILPKFDDVVRAHVEYMKANPDLNVEIQGNCDERGSREYNLGLGNRRALAVKAALEIEGISPGRITITSFGSEKPLALGHDEASWQQNRRADFVY